MSVSRETNEWRTWSGEKILHRGAQAVGLALTPEQTDGLLRYFDEVRRWNTRINLIGPGRPPDQIVLHLLDCLAPAVGLPTGRLRMLDIGSGAGLPGLVLKIIRPDWDVVLAEPRANRAGFLRHAIRTLRLERATVREGRIGDDPNDPDRESFDLTTFRGLGDLNDVLPMAARMTAPGGRILVYKGPRGDNELTTASEDMARLGLSVINEQRLQLPFLDHQRLILHIRKEN